jgi:hypothetical protein
MKKVQKIIIIIYLILVAIASIYVPWKINYVVEIKGNDDPIRWGTAYRYSFLWTSPSLNNLTRLSYDEKIQINDMTMERWMIPYELVALTAIFGVLLILISEVKAIRKGIIKLFILISKVKTIRKGIIKLIIAYLVLVVLVVSVYNCIPCKFTYVVINGHTGGVRRIGTTDGCSFFGKPVFIVPILPGEEVKSSATSGRRLIPYELIPLTAIFGALLVLTLWPKRTDF